MSNTNEVYSMPWRGTFDRETGTVNWHTPDPDFGDPLRLLPPEMRNRPKMDESGS